MNGPTWDDDGPYQVSFGIEKSRRYHEKMSGFYQSWFDYTSVANALVSVGAVIALSGGKESTFAQIMVGAVAIASTVSATLKPVKKAKVHADLQRRFTDLSAAMANRVPTQENVRWAESQRRKIEKDELPVRRLVDFMATNEERRARGVDPSEFIPLSWMQKRFGYLRDFGIGKIDKWYASRHPASQ